MNKILITTVLCLAAGCQQNTAINQTTKPDIAPSTNASPSSNNSTNALPMSAVNDSSNNSNKAKIRTFPGRGVVTRINLELGSVGLDHEEIKGIMPAMQGMEFYVSDKKMLDDLKIGDKVDFVLEDNAGAERLVSIKKS